jgi:hypothetical protein
MPQPNTTSWSKWHFDAVNQNNPNESIAFTFVLGTEEALPEEGSKSGLVTVNIMFSFADGTTKEVKIDSGEGDAGKVRSFFYWTHHFNEVEALTVSRPSSKPTSTAAAQRGVIQAHAGAAMALPTSLPTPSRSNPKSMAFMEPLN